MFVLFVNYVLFLLLTSLHFLSSLFRIVLLSDNNKCKTLLKLPFEDEKANDDDDDNTSTFDAF